MKPGLQVGEVYEFTLTVTEEMRAHFGEVEVHPLYSTASMITHMEWAARQHILPYLEPGEEGVGYHVDVKHLAPTPIGATVRVRATVMEVQLKRVTSHVEAWNDLTQIGDGTFIQGLVPIAKLKEGIAPFFVEVD
jgi:predicted thioesterase